MMKNMPKRPLSGKRTSSLSRSKPRQRGSSLLEVLISLFVLAFGLLGVAGMQISSLRATQSSLERSQAVFLTHAILDAMRANMDNTSGTPGDLSGLKVKTDYSSTVLHCNSPVIGVSDPLAAEDLGWWVEYLKLNLGSSACGQVNCNGNLCTVTIQWDDSRGEKTQASPPTTTPMTITNRSLL
jgi:type IV pilus assembly protein PilV